MTNRTNMDEFQVMDIANNCLEELKEELNEMQTQIDELKQHLKLSTFTIMFILASNALVLFTLSR